MRGLKFLFNKWIREKKVDFYYLINILTLPFRCGLKLPPNNEGQYVENSESWLLYHVKSSIISKV
jgi:hypothetical protein